MKQKTFRRNFIKNGLLASFALIFLKNKTAHASSIADANSGATFYEIPDNETLSTIQNLHTTHGNFSDSEITDEDIETIKLASVRAANSSNMQTYSIMVIRNRDMMKKICGYSGSCLMLYNVDYNRIIASAQSLDLPYYPDNMTSFITGSINASIAAQTATIAARSMGIDTLLTNGIHRGNMERQWELLGLPQKYCFPLIALVLGYADREPEHKVGRLTGKGIFHSDWYHTLSDEELKKITALYDDPELHIGLNPNYKERGHEHYLEWLYKEWLARNSKPTENETQLLTQLKKRGFMEMM